MNIPVIFALERSQSEFEEYVKKNGKVVYGNETAGWIHNQQQRPAPEISHRGILLFIEKNDFEPCTEHTPTFAHPGTIASGSIASAFLGGVGIICARCKKPLEPENWVVKK